MEESPFKLTSCPFCERIQLPPDCFRQPRRTVSWLLPVEVLVALMLLLLWSVEGVVLVLGEALCVLLGEALWVWLFWSLLEGTAWVWLLAPEAASGPFWSLLVPVGEEAPLFVLCEPIAPVEPEPPADPAVPEPPADPPPACANAILLASANAIKSFLFMCCSFEVFSARRAFLVFSSH
jgi:hypothetical protein